MCPFRGRSECTYTAMNSFPAFFLSMWRQSLLPYRQWVPSIRLLWSIIQIMPPADVFNLWKNRSILVRPAHVHMSVSDIHATKQIVKGMSLHETNVVDSFRANSWLLQSALLPQTDPTLIQKTNARLRDDRKISNRWALLSVRSSHNWLLLTPSVWMVVKHCATPASNGIPSQNLVDRI